ncbi:MAG: response regulator [Oligoflexales bacterium]|nr:response regulator [Oligoflexales bacterium]
MTKYHVAIIEDDEDVSDLIEDYLESELKIPMSFDKYDDASHALSQLFDKDYDLIITDFKMPGMSGFELIKKLRMISKYNSTPVVFISGAFNSLEVASTDEAFEKVFFISKPFEAGRLAKQIKLVLLAK